MIVERVAVPEALARLRRAYDIILRASARAKEQIEIKEVNALEAANDDT